MRLKSRPQICAWFTVVGPCCSALAQQGPAWQFDRGVNRDALPNVPAGFEVSFFAREPLVRQPSAMAFDAKGRLCVGMGPQYRNPKPNTPGDSVVLVLDTDGDGKADRTKTVRITEAGTLCAGRKGAGSPVFPPIFPNGKNMVLGISIHARALIVW